MSTFFNTAVMGTIGFLHGISEEHSLKKAVLEAGGFAAGGAVMEKMGVHLGWGDVAGAVAATSAYVGISLLTGHDMTLAGAADSALAGVGLVEAASYLGGKSGAAPAAPGASTATNSGMGTGTKVALGAGAAATVAAIAAKVGGVNFSNILSGNKTPAAATAAGGAAAAGGPGFLAEGEDALKSLLNGDYPEFVHKAGKAFGLDDSNSIGGQIGGFIKNHESAAIAGGVGIGANLFSCLMGNEFSFTGMLKWGGIALLAFEALKALSQFTGPWLHDAAKKAYQPLGYNRVALNGAGARTDQVGPHHALGPDPNGK